MRAAKTINGVATGTLQWIQFKAFTSDFSFKNTGAVDVQISFGRPVPYTDFFGVTHPAELIDVAAGETFPYDGSFAEIQTDGFDVISTGGPSAFEATGLV